jgi:hypothetical protein
MNYIHHLQNFYLRANGDKRLKALHISLYMALFNEWNNHRFTAIFPILREKMMKNSHIGSKDTLTQAFKQLAEFGYIVYHPALHPRHFIKITILIQKSAEEKQPELFSGPNMAGSSPEMTGSNTTGSSPNMGAKAPDSGEVSPPNPGHFNKQYKQSKGIEREAHSHHHPSSETKNFKIPTMEEVLTWFDEQHADSEIALSFFYHYSANGWIIGKQPMRNWQAAASKWILTQRKTPDHGKQNPYHIKTRKNYEDPL